MSKQNLRLVVAYTQNRIIGHQGGMPWDLPADLQHFKRSTMGHPIIMGRKTWLSIGRPLPGRRNIVLSRDTSFSANGADCYTDLQTALASCEDDDTVCIIGGEQLFKTSLPFASQIYATEIHANIAGDTWFPALPENQWVEADRQPQPTENGLDYDFVVYLRN